jgi:hypothetical protein
MPRCFRLAKMCLCQVRRLSRCNTRYLTTTACYRCGPHVALRVVKVTKTVTDHFVCGVDSPLNVMGLKENQLLTAK